MTILTKLPILAAARTAKHNRLLRRTTKVNPFTRGLLLGVVFILWMGLSQFYDDEDIQPSTTHKSKKIQISVSFAVLLSTLSRHSRFLFQWQLRHLHFQIFVYISLMYQTLFWIVSHWQVCWFFGKEGFQLFPKNVDFRKIIYRILMSEKPICLS